MSTLLNQINIILSSKLTGSAGLSDVTAVVAETVSTTLVEVACDALYTVTEEITGTENALDLVGALTDPLGDVVQFAKVMAIFVRNNAVANGMSIGGNAASLELCADKASDKIALAHGAYFLLVDENGITVTSGSTDILQINGTAGDAYDIIVIGTAV